MPTAIADDTYRDAAFETIPRGELESSTPAWSRFFPWKRWTASSERHCSGYGRKGVRRHVLTNYLSLRAMASTAFIPAPKRAMASRWRSNSPYGI